MPEHRNPFPGQVIRDVNFGPETWYEENVGEYRPTVETPDKGTVVTSEVADRENRWLPVKNLHKPVLDIDLPVIVLPSSTEGHHHLYIDKVLTWDQYVELLDVLVKVGIVQEGFRNASVAREHTAVRLPWIKKESNG